MVRRLAYSDRSTDYLENVISEDTTGQSVFDDLVIPMDTKSKIIIEVTGQEFTDLLSSVMTGADLKFTDNAHQLTWLLWKAKIFMSGCDDIAECIEISEPVQEALLMFTTITGGNSGVGNPVNVLPTEDREANLLDDAYTCDNNHRYGTALGVVQAIHDATIEIFQAIEILTNPSELAAELADNVPIAEAAGIPLEIINHIQDTAYEAYNLAWSQVVKEEIACELFCLMLDYDPCHLDFEMVMSAYSDITFPATPSILDPWYDWALWWIALPFADAARTVKAGGLLGLLVMRYGGKFGSFSLGIRTFKTVVQLLRDETEEDWDILCTACPGRWEHTWAFDTHGMEVWTLVDDEIGEYVAASGMECRLQVTAPYTNNHVNRLRFNEEVPRCDTIKFHTHHVKGGWEAGNLTAAYISGGGVPGAYKQWNQGAIIGGSGMWETNFPIATCPDVWLYFRVAKTDTENYGSGAIVYVTLAGEGADPFEGRVTS